MLKKLPTEAEKSMDNDDLKIISEKLSLIIKIMLLNDEKYQKMTAVEKISMVNDVHFSSEQIAFLLDIPVKTVRNILPKLKNK